MALLLATIVAGAPTGLSGNLTLTMKNATAVEATMKNTIKPDACVDGGAACASSGGSCCYSPDSDHDCCCESGYHCTVFSGTSCGVSCAPDITASDFVQKIMAKQVATEKVENVPCSPTTYCPDGDICCTACNGCCPSSTTCDCSAGTCDTADGAKVSMKAFIKLMESPVAAVATKKVENVPCSPTTYCPDGDICCTACNGCCPSGTTCDCSAGTCDTADGAKVSMKAFIKLMTEVA